MNKTIFRTLFGSHLYGTNTPESDKDYKAIFLADPKDILLERAPTQAEQNTKKSSAFKNKASDVDDESISVKKYLEDLLEGQTYTLDMLFANKECVLVAEPEFQLIWQNREAFFHKGLQAFVGYTKAQAAKYGVKGFRMAAVKRTIDWLGFYVPDYRLDFYDSLLRDFALDSKSPYIQVVSIDGAKGPEPALEVCGRKFPFHATVAYTINALAQIYNNYGQRAKQAENNQGIDWKALSHAVRVACEAQELLLTHNITFPRPEADLLLQIKMGVLPFKQVSEIIEEGLAKTEAAALVSTLPEKPDFHLAEQILLELNKERMRSYVTSVL